MRLPLYAQIKLRTLISLALTSAFIILAASCQPPPPSESENSGIIHRSETEGPTIAIVKLKNPALFSHLSGSGLIQRIPPHLAEGLIREQTLFIRELQKISKDITVLYHYRFVLNGLAIVIPPEVENKIKQLPALASFESASIFDLPDSFASDPSISRSKIQDLSIKNSVSFISADRIHREIKVRDAKNRVIPVRGKGVKIGVIDSGIDYTHSMFAGSGQEEDFKNINPDQTYDNYFPNRLVVGGVDLVGSQFSPSSPNQDHHIPNPDGNPIDEGGHGTHVAGTISGQGDGVETYDGVAPEASLYAIKVFSKTGSTNTAAIIAALEYAANPSGDMTGTDRLDVVNLSLGSGHGEPQFLYNEAVTNASKGGIVVVAAAGNSGPLPHIVASPSTSDAAISVAASIDGMDHNWRQEAVQFKSSLHEEPLLAERAEATFTKPLSEYSELNGKLVFIGLADKDLTEEQQEALKGHLALIDRGGVAFHEKIVRAEAAGAIGVVMVNNTDEDPIVMGGTEEKVGIPAIMIAKNVGNVLKSVMRIGEVTAELVSDKAIERPWLIDTLTNFSSRGPRSIDSVIKPEVAAPGLNIISAAMGGGSKGVKLNGTSMASPHIAGVAALIRQVRPEASSEEIKSRLINTALPIGFNGQRYGVALQGGGRVNAFAAITTPLIATPATVSLGRVGVREERRIQTKITIQNLSNKTLKLSLNTEQDQGLTLTAPASISLRAGQKRVVNINAELNVESVPRTTSELNGWVTYKSEDENVVLRLPVLAVIAKETNIIARRALDITDESPRVTLENRSPHNGQALFFNLIGLSPRQPTVASRPERNTRCDLQAAGYRIIKSPTGMDYIDFALKLFNPISTWHHCEVSIQFRSSAQGEAEQELTGQMVSQTFYSILHDAEIVRNIQKDFEKNGPAGSYPDYNSAVIAAGPGLGFGQSTIAMVRMLKDPLAQKDGITYIKVAALPVRSAGAYGDDFLKNHDKKWIALSLDPDNQPFKNIPEVIEVKGYSNGTLDFQPGKTRGSLMMLSPYNFTTVNGRSDNQMQLLSFPARIHQATAP